MSLRFQRRIRIAPGIRLNFGRRGVSATVGPRGASINFGPRGAYANVGIPGTGISSRTRLDEPVRQDRMPPAPAPSERTPLPVEAGVVSRVEVESSGDLTSANLSDLVDEIEKARRDIWTLSAQERETRKLRSRLTGRMSTLRIVTLGGLFGKTKLKELRERRDMLDAEISAFPTKMEDAQIEIEPDLSDDAKWAWARVRSTFLDLRKSEKIWDVTSTTTYDQTVTRMAHETGVSRDAITFDEAAMPSQPFSAPLLRMGNRNGPDLFWSPAFIATWNNGRLALTDLAHVEFRYVQSDFIEGQGVPSDSKVIGSAWLKSNKDGSPDRRFRDNVQIPRVKYGTLLFHSSTGILEWYMCSNEELAQEFAKAMDTYLSMARAESKNVEPPASRGGEVEPRSDGPFQRFALDL